MRKTFLEKCINLRLCRVALVLLFLVPAISSLQANPSQNKTISGVVTSATDSEPLIGVSVQVRETATGGITDIDGRYSVSAQQGQTLVFSYIGYQSQEIKVGTSSVINVVLNLFFVIVCKMAPDGVALASIISQYLSAVLVLLHMTRLTDSCRVE